MFTNPNVDGRKKEVQEGLCYWLPAWAKGKIRKV